MEKENYRKKILLTVGAYLDGSEPEKTHHRELEAIDDMLCEALEIDKQCYPEYIYSF